jgi:hypothetical protein
MSLYGDYTTGVWLCQVQIEEEIVPAHKRARLQCFGQRFRQ